MLGLDRRLRRKHAVEHLELCRHVVLELMARCAVQSIETFTSLGTFMASGLLPLHAFLHFRFNPAAPATVPLPLPLTLPLPRSRCP